MKPIKIILAIYLFTQLGLFSEACPKNLSVKIDSPKQKEEVNGAKQKINIKINNKENLNYHIVQTNQDDKTKTWYLQSAGKIESEAISGYVWLGNDVKGKGNLFTIKVIVSNKFIPKDNKIIIWKDDNLKPTEVCGTDSIQLKRVN